MAQPKPKLAIGKPVRITTNGKEGRVKEVRESLRGWFVDVNFAPKGKPAEIGSYRASQVELI